MSEEPQAEVTPAEEETESSSSSQRLSGVRGNTPLIIAIVVAVFAFLAVCILGVLLFREVRVDTPPTTVEELTPTPLTVRPTSEPNVQIVSESGVISITLGTPTLLKLPSQEFTIQTDVVGADGVWNPGVTDDGQASWVNGTFVNYVVGLPGTQTNETMLGQLVPGDEIQLVTNGRASFTFAFTDRELVSRSDSSVFAQQMPGITLILLKSDGDQRLVVRGRYVIAEAGEPPRNVVSMGETAQLDNVQVTVNAATYVADRAEIPSGFAFFQVDYAIQNVGLTALDTSLLEMTLVDELGNRYALNPAASQNGNYPVLNGFLNANQVTNATAGYQVPLGLNSESVNWVVTNQETNAQVFITLPFTGGATAVQGTSISLFRAEVSADMTSLNLGGQITNLGTQPLVATESDIQLTSPDGAVYLLLATNPPLPWTIAPGQTVQFFVSYQRPPSGTAVFTVLNQEFQITEQ